MSRFGRRLFVVVCLAATPASAHAAKFYASVDQQQVAVGDTVRLVVTISVSDRAGITRLELPDTGKFEEVSRRQSSQMSFTFGRGGQSMQTVITHTVVLRAVETGGHTIGAGTMVFQGKKYQTKPRNVMVVKHRAAAPAAAPTPYAPMPGPQPSQQNPFAVLDDLLRGTQFRSNPGDDDLVLRVTTNTRNVWLGEQVTLYIQVVSRMDVADFPGFKMPKHDGFWVEDLNSPSRISPTTKYIDGKAYRVYTLRRQALFPMKAGEVEITGVEVKIMHAFGLFRSGRTVTRRSKAFPIKVKPLPAKGQPKAFPTTNVGRWSLSASVDTVEAELGQPVTFTLKARGTGSLHGLKLPDLPEIDGLKVYDATYKQRVQIKGGVFGGQKSAEWVVVPTRTGELEIPSLTLHYFDPEHGRYRSRKTDPIVLSVKAGSGTVVPAKGGVMVVDAAANVLDSRGLRSIRYSTRLHRVGPVSYRRPVFFVLLGLPVFGLVLLLGAQRMRAVFQRSEAEGEQRRAPGLARAKFKAARKLQRKGDLRGAFAEVERALRDYVTLKTGIAARGLPQDALSEALREQGYGQVRVERLCSVLADCEVARFSPTPPTGAQMDRLLDRASRVLENLEAGPSPEEKAA